MGGGVVVCLCQVAHQKTPVRVLHRRSPLVRDRTIHSIECEPLPGLSPHCLLIHLNTQVAVTHCSINQIKWNYAF
jgi:tRNA pseudouridine synthase 10